MRRSFEFFCINTFNGFNLIQYKYGVVFQFHNLSKMVGDSLKWFPYIIYLNLLEIYLLMETAGYNMVFF